MYVLLNLFVTVECSLSLTVALGSANANEALTISLYSPTKTGLVPLGAFHPKFTYSIFGDDETIFGYKDLKINLRFRANDMRPHLEVKYSRKFKAVGGTEPADVKAILQEGHHLPRSKNPS